MKSKYLIFLFTVFTSAIACAQQEAENNDLSADSVAAVRADAEKGKVDAQKLLASWYFDGTKPVQRDYEQAVFWWDKAAKQKDAEAIGKLAVCYQYGKGVQPDSAYAVKLYESAVSRGNETLVPQLEDRAVNDKEVFAALVLRNIYQKGIKTKINQNKADEYLLMAAKYGDNQSAFLYGLTQYNKKNRKESLGWFKKAADNGHDVANFMYGLQLFEGDETYKDIVKGIEYMDRAARVGNVAANAELGRVFLNGEGVDKDVDKAVSYLKIAAVANRQSAWMLGNCYKDGVGVNRNYSQAIHWMTESIDDGKETRDRIEKMIADDNDGPFTQYLRGLYRFDIDNNYAEALSYFRTVEKAKVIDGVTMIGKVYATKDYDKYNPKKAVKLLNKAAKTSPLANYYLYEIYASDSIMTDKALAGEFLEKAAEQDNQKAICKLADMYMTGIGKSMDLSKAAELYLKAEKLKGLDKQAAQNLAKCYELKVDVLPDLDNAEQRISQLKNFRQNDKINLLLSKVKMK